MKRLYPIGIFCLMIMASSCADKTICPAFQSYYLLDEDKRDNMFSYFGEDSLPKQQEGIVSKNMFGIIEKPNYLTVGNVSIPKNDYKARNAVMQTIRMEVIYPSDEEDSLNLGGVRPDSSQASNQYESDVNFDLPDYSNVFDTVAASNDTAAVKPDFHYNIDQLYYMELIGDEIMDARQERIDSLQTQREEQATKGDASQADPKEKQGFFKRIMSKFKKKKDPVSDDQADGAILPDDEGEQVEGKSKKEKKEKKPKEEKEKKTPFWKKDKEKNTEEEDPGN